MTSCLQCGFNFESLDANEAPALIRHTARQIRERLGGLLAEERGVEALRTRLAPETWSALEYASHVRDVLLTQRERLYQTLLDDIPSFMPVHPEQRVLLGRYDDEDPATTSTEVTIAADLLARLLDRLDRKQWSRRFRAFLPALEERDLRWLARHSAHEAVHHLLDIDVGLEALRAGRSDLPAK